MRNLRIVIAIERQGRWLAERFAPQLPAGHVREGESLRYALSRIARERCGAQLRVHDIVAIAEREGRRVADRCIDVYVRASIAGNHDAACEWLDREALRLAGLPPSLVHALESARGAPYLGNIRPSDAGAVTKRTQRSRRTQGDGARRNRRAG